MLSSIYFINYLISTMTVNASQADWDEWLIAMVSFSCFIAICTEIPTAAPGMKKVGCIVNVLFLYFMSEPFFVFSDRVRIAGMLFSSFWFHFLITLPSLGYFILRPSFNYLILWIRSPTLLSQQRKDELKQLFTTKKGLVSAKQVINRVIGKTTRVHERGYRTVGMTDIAAVSGVTPGNDEWARLNNDMQKKYPRWPSVQREEYRQVFKDLRYWFTYAELEVNHFGFLWDFFYNFSIPALGTTLATFAFWTMLHSIYPSGSAMISMIFGVCIWVFIYRVWLYFGLMSHYLSPTYWINRAGDVLNDPFGIHANIMMTVMTSMKQRPAGIALQAHSVYNSSTAGEFITRVWVLGSLLGLETIVIQALLRRLVPDYQTNNPDLPGTPGTREGPEFKTTIFMAAIFTGLFGYTSGTIDTKILTTLAGVTASALTLEKCWEAIETALCEWGFITTAKYEHVGKMMEKLAGLISLVAESSQQMGINGSYFLVPAHFTAWNTAYEEIETLRKDLSSNKYSALVGTSFAAEVRLLGLKADQLNIDINAFVQSCGIRICPVGVMFEGPSQIGKSHFTTWLIRKIKDRIVELVDPKSPVARMFDNVKHWGVWDQNFRDEYDQGYNGQRIHSIDDCFTKKDHTDHPALIQFISPKRCGTVQAALHDKGKPYVAQMVIASCNVPPESSSTITNLDALYNRFMFWIQVNCGFEGDKQKTPPMNTNAIDTSFSWLSFEMSSGRDRWARNNTVPTVKEEIVEVIAQQMISNAERYLTEMAEAQMNLSPAAAIAPALASPAVGHGPIFMLSSISSAVTGQFKKVMNAIREGPQTDWNLHWATCDFCQKNLPENSIRPDQNDDGSANSKLTSKLIWNHIGVMGTISCHSRITNEPIITFKPITLQPQDVNAVLNTKLIHPIHMLEKQEEIIPFERDTPQAEWWNLTFPTLAICKDKLTGFNRTMFDMYARAMSWTPQQYAEYLISGTRRLSDLMKDHTFLAIVALIILILVMATKLCVTEADFANLQGVVSSDCIKLPGKRLFVISGAGISSIGKGTVAAALIKDLVAAGKKVTAIKIDPYYNYNAGSFNPSEHGETFVTADGVQADLDLGRYYRAGASITGRNVMTGGWLRTEANNLRSEASITDESMAQIARAHILSLIAEHDDTIVEVGGTITDTEAVPFQRALHHIMTEVTTYNILVAPLASTTHGEPKTRMIKEGIKQARAAYGQPITCVMYRTESAVIGDIDEVKCIPIPTSSDANRMKAPLEAFSHLLAEPIPHVDIPNPERRVHLTIISKYSSPEAHTSIIESFEQALYPKVGVNVSVATHPSQISGNTNAFVISGGFGKSNINELLECIRIARQTGRPMLGICFGHQLAFKLFQNMPMAELGDGNRLGEGIWKGPQQIGLYNGHIYRNTYYVTPRSFGFMGAETVVRNKIRQPFVSRMDWDANFVSVQYHPEYELDSAEFKWLADKVLESTQEVLPLWRHENDKARNQPQLSRGNPSAVATVTAAITSDFKLWKSKPHAVRFGQTNRPKIVIAPKDIASRLLKKIGEPGTRQPTVVDVWWYDESGRILDRPFHTKQVIEVYNYCKDNDDFLITLYQEHTRLQNQLVLAGSTERQATLRLDLPAVEQRTDYTDRVMDCVSTGLIDNIEVPTSANDTEFYDSLRMSAVGNLVKPVSNNWFPTWGTRQTLNVSETDIFSTKTPILHFVHNHQKGYSGFAKEVSNRTHYFKNTVNKHAALHPLTAPVLDRIVITQTKEGQKVYNLISHPDICLDDLKNLGTCFPEKEVAMPLIGTGLWKKEVQDVLDAIANWTTSIIMHKLPGDDRLNVTKERMMTARVNTKAVAVTMEVDIPELPSQTVQTTDAPVDANLEDLDNGAVALFHAMKANMLAGVSIYNRHDPLRLSGALSGWGFGSYIFCNAHILPTGVNHVENRTLVRVSKFRDVPVNRLFNPDDWTLALVVNVKWDWDLACVRMLTKNELKSYSHSGLQVMAPFNQNLMKHVATEEQISAKKISSGAILYPPLTGIAVAVSTRFQSQKLFNFGADTQAHDTMEVNLLTATTSITQPGDCGGPLILTDSHYTQKLVGMHTIKTQDRLYAMTVSREKLLALLDGAPANFEGPLSDEFDDKWEKVEWASAQEGNLQTEFIDWDPTKAHLAPNGPAATVVGVTKFEVGSIPQNSDRITKAPYYGCFEADMQPACLSADDPRITPENLALLERTKNGKPSILVTQITEYAKDHETKIDEALLAEVFQEVEDYMVETLYHQGIPVNAPDNLDEAIAEAINGNTLIPGYDRIDLNAGAGALWASMGVTTKRKLFEVPKTERMRDGTPKPNLLERAWFKRTDPAARACYGQVKAQLTVGEQLKKLTSIVTDKIKVETKPMKHIVRGKSRTYSDVPVDDLLAKRAVFGRLKAAKTAAGTSMFHGVATNPHSMDWTGLAMYLAELPERNCADGDYSNFDRRIDAAIGKGVVRMNCNIIKRLHPDDKWYNTRLTLGHRSLYALSAADNVVWEATRGNKSGDLMTTCDNNDANLIGFVYAWRVLTGLSFTMFREHVRILTFGDDVVWNTSDAFKDVFNFHEIAKVMATMGHEFTPASKDGQVKLGLDKVTFLKRSFKKIGAFVYVAPLAKNSIWAPFSWSQLSHGDVEGWNNTMSAALIEAHLHGSEYYQECRQKLRQYTRINEHKNYALYSTLRKPLEKSYADLRYEYAGIMGLIEKVGPCNSLRGSPDC